MNSDGSDQGRFKRDAAVEAHKIDDLEAVVEAGSAEKIVIVNKAQESNILKENIEIIQKTLNMRKKVAISGNRTRVYRVAGGNYTTKPRLPG